MRGTMRAKHEADYERHYESEARSTKQTMRGTMRAKHEADYERHYESEAQSRL
jgi:hypothetical protein